MTARAFDIMRELPAVFATVTGIDAADVEIGYRDPAGIESGLLPRVLVYNPSTAEPAAPSYGLRSLEFGFVVLLAHEIDQGEAALQLVEDMAEAVNVASFTNADRAFMNPGSLVTDEERRQSLVLATIVAAWEGE